MGQILIRNLDDAVLDALRKRAQLRGASLEEEARGALTASVGLTREEALSRIDRIRAKIGTISGESVVEELRKDRRRDVSDGEP
jgi:plasmid stability protein